MVGLSAGFDSYLMLTYDMGSNGSGVSLHMQSSSSSGVQLLCLQSGGRLRVVLISLSSSFDLV